MRILMILIPDTDGAQDAGTLMVERVAVPYYIFLDAGIEIVLASPDGGSPRIKPSPADSAPAQRFSADRQARDAVADTLALSEVHVGDFEAAFCIGVAGPVWALGNDPAARMIGRFLDDGKPVAVIPSHLDVDPLGSHHGLLILGESHQSPAQAANALLGILLVSPGGIDAPRG